MSVITEKLTHRDPYQHYYKLSDNDISKRLAAKRMPEATKARLLETILENKAAHISKEASDKRKKYLWRQLLTPAKYELKMSNLMLTKTQQQVENGYYANPDEGEARVLAMSAYCKCIEYWVIGQAYEWQRQGMTPAGAAKEKTKRFPAGMPNNGSHWVDWVPSTVREQVTALFDAIPRRAKAKRKVPFERKMPHLSRIDHGEVLSVFEEQRIMLREKTERALEKVAQLAKVDPDTYSDDLERVKTALRYINDAKEGEILPKSWKGYFV